MASLKLKVTNHNSLVPVDSVIYALAHTGDDDFITTFTFDDTPPTFTADRTALNTTMASYCLCSDGV